MDDIGEFLGRAQATYDAGEKMLRQMRSDAAAPAVKPEAPAISIPLAGPVVDDETAAEIEKIGRRERARSLIEAELEKQEAAKATAAEQARAEAVRRMRANPLAGLIGGLR